MTTTCVRCWQPWGGFGLVCNECATIAAIKKQTQAIESQNTVNRYDSLIDNGEFDYKYDPNLSDLDKSIIAAKRKHI